MKHLLLVLLVLVGNKSSGAELTPSTRHLKSVPVFKMGNEKLFCVQQGDLNNATSITEMPQVQIFSSHTPGLMGTITCYQCCVGEAPNTRESCKKVQFNNWARGKNCGC